MSYEHHIGDIKKGDRFCEFDGYRHGVRYTALEDGHLDGKYWTVLGKSDAGKECTFSIDKDLLHYGPELYAGEEVPYSNVEYV